MLIGDPILAIVAYPALLILPGLFWTFIFKDRPAGALARLAISAGISVSAMTTCVFVSYQFLGWNVNLPTVLAIMISVTLFPLLIALVANFLPLKHSISKPGKMLGDAKDFILGFFKLGNYRSRHRVILGLILLLGIALTLAPHFGYGLPIHTDEWHYMAGSDNLINQESQNPTSLYYDYGQSRLQHWEMGFIVFLSVMKIASGISWPFLFTTLPSILFSLAILTAYLIGKKYNWGLQTAFLLALTPSTLRFLGPAFLVPASIGILMIVFSLYLITCIKIKWKYPLIMLALLFTFIAHPPSGGYLFIVLAASALVSIARKERKEAMCLGGILLLFLAAAFTLPLNYMEGMSWEVLTRGSRFFLPHLTASGYLGLTGFIIPILATIGVAFILKNRQKAGQTIALALYSMIAFVLVIYYVYPNFFSVQAVFDRAIMVIIILAGIIAGVGLAVIQQNVSKPFSIILICCILALSLNSHAGEPYYHIISQDEYEDFIWIRENLNSSYERAILDPWKAVAFTPVTGKMVFYAIPQGPGDPDMDYKTGQIAAFFAGGCTDTQFLVANDIDIVYTHGYCGNPDLTEVRPGVYVLEG